MARSGKGSVYLYRHTEATSEWNFVTVLQPDVEASPSGNFGLSIALDDGSGTLVVGAPNEGDNGVAFVFKRASDGTWSQFGDSFTVGQLGDEFGFR